MFQTGARGPAAAARAPLFFLLGWLAAVLGWWAFAFVPVTAGAPGWLEAAKSACFGSLSGGLPNSGGWMMLVAAPLLLLAALLVIHGPSLGASLRWAWPQAGWRAALALIAALLLAEGAWVAGRYRAAKLLDQPGLFQSGDEGPLPDAYPRGAKAVPEFKLVDAEGRAFGRGDLLGRPWVLAFVFGHCKTVCPFLVRDALLATRSMGQGPGALFVTMDPWRDTPASLPGLAQAWGLRPGEELLSGPAPEVNRLLDGLDMERSRDPKSGEIQHAAVVLVLDSQARVAYRFLNPPKNWLREALRRAR